jgi:hypothetical protein
MANKWQLVDPSDSTTFPAPDQPILIKFSNLKKANDNTTYLSGFFNPTTMPPYAFFDSDGKVIGRVDERVPLYWIYGSDLEKNIPKK